MTTRSIVENIKDITVKPKGQEQVQPTEPETKTEAKPETEPSLFKPETETTEAKPTEPTEPNPTEPVVEKVDEQKEVIDTGIMTFTINKGEEEKVIETGEQFLEMIKNKYKLDAKSYKDVLPLIEKGSQAETLEQKVLEHNTKEEFMQNYFNTMPDDLAMVLADYNKGNDYKQTMSAITSQSKDFRDVNTFDKDELILMYNNDFSKEDLEELEDKTKNALYKVAKATHEGNKREYERLQQEGKKQVQELAKQQEDLAKQVFTSIDNSITNLKKQYSNVKPEYISSIENLMKKGFGTVLVDKTGMYSVDAAEKIFYAVHGKQIIESLKSELEKSYQKKINQVASQEREQAVAQFTNDQLQQKTHGSDTKDIGKAVEESLPPGLRK